jgi:hypothetical protein
MEAPVKTTTGPRDLLRIADLDAAQLKQKKGSTCPTN